MGGFKGADVAELRDLAAVFTARSSTLRTLEARLTGSVNGARWEGPDAARFVGEWNARHRKAIAAATALFDGAARDLRANADQQDRASEPAGAAVGGGTGPDGGGSRVTVDTAPSYTEIAVQGTTGPIDYSLLAGAGAQAHSDADLVVSSAGIAGSATAMARAGAWFDGHAGYQNGPLSAQANAAGFAGALAQASASGSVGTAGVDAQAQAEATAGARLRVDGSVAAGPVGVSGNAGAFAGATASAEAREHLGWDGVAQKVKGEAFAGARADAGITTGLFGVDTTAKATAMAGVGISGRADVTLTWDQVHLGFGGGVSVGLGAGVGYDVSFSPREMAQGIVDVGGGLADAASGATRFVASAWPFD